VDGVHHVVQLAKYLVDDVGLSLLFLITHATNLVCAEENSFSIL
jgi:hypothetical protein